MTKKSKSRKAKAEPTTLTVLRVANVATAHGNFLRLMYITSLDGVVVSAEGTHDYFQDAGEIEARLHQIASALQLPIVDVSQVARKH